MEGARDVFGYVRVRSSELKVKEYELYRGAYCGLCRSMGKCTGQCSRMALSYDFAFLAMLRLCLGKVDKIEFKQRRCLAHPLKKRNVMERNAELDYCARAAAILGYHKIRDDIADERGFKKARALITYPFVASWRKKALKAGLLPLDEKVSDALARLSALETKKKPSVDEPAEIFGEILAAITSFGLDGSEARIAYEIGMHVGKWIYIVDALDDADDDLKKKRYNPFLLLYGGRLPKGAELSLISDALKAELCGAEAALDLVDTDKESVKNIIENILYLGMPDTVEKVICGGERDCKTAQKGSMEDERSL